ncbi:unnamed protein product [marine sediment metagenome]|uniref:Uncharacterized protein n=1 Tax=marine sediment metagenome TaxID=412755 RepID=X1CHX8_9ZZZZ
MTARYATYKTKLHQKIVLSALANSIANAANKHGIQLKSILPKKIEIESKLVLHPIQITVISNYQQLIAFIKALNQLSYFMVLQDFSLKAVKNDHAKLTLRAWLVVYNEDTK